MKDQGKEHCGSRLGPPAWGAAERGGWRWEAQGCWCLVQRREGKLREAKDGEMPLGVIPATRRRLGSLGQR